MWARNGRELFFTRLTDSRSIIAPRDIMVVDITTDPVFTASRPQPLFRGQYFGSLHTPRWEVTPDGRKFLLVEETRGPLRRFTELNVVLNWFEELNRLVPTE